MDIAELRRQHDEISLIAAQLGEAVSDESAPRQVARLRWQLARLLMTHLALEDRLLYPATVHSSDDDTRKTAAALQQEMGDLAARFSSYMTAWSDDRILREWSAFCTQTRAMLTALADRVDSENRILYPLLIRAAADNPRRKAS
ncbi:hemerythrin domain-containing protein [Sphingobium fontiphilum]|nr:hemerythrin domain-containing protein [Sphingobium fontiphilum]